MKLAKKFFHSNSGNAQEMHNSLQNALNLISKMEEPPTSNPKSVNGKKKKNNRQKEYELHNDSDSESSTFTQENDTFDTFDELIFGPKITKEESTDDEEDEEEEEVEVSLSKKIILKKEMVEFGSIIGRGTFGIVYEGKLKLSFGRKIDVAIKEVNLGNLNINNCKQEVNIMKEVSRNGRTCSIHGVYFENQTAFIVMELCETSLFHKLKEEEFGFQQKLKILIQIAEGMKYLHKKKIVHRDLKTQNILLDKKGQVKLTDFGNAKHFSQVNGTLCGTIEYLAPEQFDNEIAAEPFLIDIYSFGIIMYEVLSQQVPYREIKKRYRSNQMAFLNYVMKNKLRPDTKILKGKIPYILMALMRRCWEELPSRRPQSFQSIIKIIKTQRNFTCCNSSFKRIQRN